MASWMYDRENVVVDIRKLLREGRHIRVCGPRKVGKTTILENLGEELGFQFHYFNCETTGANSPESIANGMKRAFRANIPREAPGDHWMDVMHEVLEFLKIKNDNCIVIIDELSDALDKMSEDQRHDFLNGILMLPDRIGVQLIVCGSIGFDRVLNNYEQAHKIRAMLAPVYVEPFDKDTARSFIKECFSRNRLNIPDDIFPILTESIISCFGKDSLFPLFLERFITDAIPPLLRPKSELGIVISERQKEKAAVGPLDSKIILRLDTAVKDAYNERIQQVVDICENRRTGGGLLQDLAGYVHLIKGDLERTGGLSLDRAQLVTRVLQMDKITPGIISLIGDEGIERILRNLKENYLIKKSGENYISYVKFLMDVWSRLYPLEVELEERRDE